MQLRKCGMVALAIVAILAAAAPARAQITTGNISGTVNDSQGGVIPGATVVLKSETRGTASAPVVTNEAGVYVFPNITPDVYTIEVTMDSFKTVRRTNIRVSGGDRVGVPAMVLEAGGVAETVNVSAEALLVQSQSAERSFAVSSEQIEGLPINRQNFTNLLAFAPGVKIAGSGSTGFERLGGVVAEQPDDGRHLGHGHRQQRHHAGDEHRVHRRDQDPHPGLSGGVRPLQRPAGHGRHQERHQPVPRIGLRRRARYPAGTRTAG